MLATLEWMDRDGDRDHDGLYEYATKAGSWGEKNQGWKDSNDAILYEDGRMVEDPIALVEIQGCFYAAKQLLGLAFASLGDHRRAEDLVGAGDRVETAVQPDLLAARGEIFRALSRSGRKNRSRRSLRTPANVSPMALSTTIRRVAVADRLMIARAVQRLGHAYPFDAAPGVQPICLSLGSVWPVSEALIGFGLKRHGFNDAFASIGKGDVRRHSALRL